MSFVDQKNKADLILFCFRRDLRIYDNAGLYHALLEAKNKSESGVPTKVLCLFIFDEEILSRLPFKNDRRVTYIYQSVLGLQKSLESLGSQLVVKYGKALQVSDELIQHFANQYKRVSFFCNADDEPYPKKRDHEIQQIIQRLGGEFKAFKDHLIFSRQEILTKIGKPYTVYTPYKNAWFSKIQDPFYLKEYPTELYFDFLLKNGISKEGIPTIESMGFQKQQILPVLQPHFSEKMLKNYHSQRNLPSQLDGTSHMGIALRFGTHSPRQLVKQALSQSEVWVSEIAWRDFFAQILFHFPYVVKQSFRKEYESIGWRKNEEELNRWKNGETGYPLVDAGMRELNETGHMHNRVRMVVASFLTKHLLHHWYEGERYFSTLLLDYDLASNNGNWQWAAGTGCDAAPYFRVFNPTTQIEKFDPQFEYVLKWVPEYKTSKYPKPMVDHAWARQRALDEYKIGIEKGRKNAAV